MILGRMRDLLLNRRIENAESKPKVIIEIGAEGNTFNKPLPQRIKDKNGNDATYIPVNIKLGDLKSTVREHPGALPVNADFKRLPFANESADEIWMMNVIGIPQPGTYNRFEDLFVVDGRDLARKDIDPTTFSECARVLKKGKQMIIGELYTPNVALKLKSITAQEWRQVNLRPVALHVGTHAEDFWRDFGGEMDPLTRKLFTRQGTQGPFFLVLEKI